MSPQAVRVNKNIPYAGDPRMIRNIVKITLRIEMLLIDCRRNVSGGNGESSGRDLENSSCSKRLPYSSLYRSDGDPIRVLSEDAFERRRLGGIVCLG